MKYDEGKKDEGKGNQKEEKVIENEIQRTLTSWDERNLPKPR